MYKREIRTCLELLKPGTAGTVEKEQFAQMQGKRREGRSHLAIGDIVC